MIDLTRLIDSIAVILEDRQPPSEEALRTIVRAQSHVIALTDGVLGGPALTEQQLAEVVRTIEARFSIRMELGAFFESDYRPWLAQRTADIDWYYWTRYRKHLLRKAFPPHVVTTLDHQTDRILDHLEDPRKEGNWARKGLVVGHVQSGKTANYTGLVCKAADAGYRVIIVLAGTLNSLRNQTQKRIDSDFIGWCTHKKHPIGVHTLDGSRRPICFTTSVADFQKQTARAIAMGLNAVNEPIVLIIKKNKSTLENLSEWLTDNNRHELQKFSMLLIDDEADYASINTRKDDESPATINLAIRNLLSLFTRTSFVGYTATPFANIFIDPESEDEMTNGQLYQDLFPRHFILSLDPPNNYVGPNRLFTDGADLDGIRHIEDNELYLPLGHKIDFTPTDLPASLQKAICCFVLAISIRLLRGHGGKCHSMLVNASRFTGVQNRLAGLVREYLLHLKQSIRNYASLPSATALQDADLAAMLGVFNTEFGGSGVPWASIQSVLRDAAEPIEVLVVNSSSAEALDYSVDQYPTGRSVIAVGGLGLSRGLTLEGLVTSYFLRTSIMYDTLMQMGRWFGYRDGYADLCRVFMTPSASSWYSHIAEATEELRREFKTMERAKLTPLEFGLRVRSHPTALIVTARNKMRTGRSVPMRIALKGRLAETSVILGDDTSLENNAHVLANVCIRCTAETPVREFAPLGFLWKNVSHSIVTAAVRSFVNHPACMITYADPLVDYIEWLYSQTGARFDVLLRSSSEGDCTYAVGDDLRIAPVMRTVDTLSRSEIVFRKRRVGSREDERAGLEQDEIEEVRRRYGKGEVPDRAYRAVSGRNPLFLIYFANVHESGEATPGKVVPAYGISFPGDPGSARRPPKLVEYVVTTTWWAQNYGLSEQEAEEE